MTSPPVAPALELALLDELELELLVLLDELALELLDVAPPPQEEDGLELRFWLILKRMPFLMCSMRASSSNSISESVVIGV